jgi:hypothetical protein
MLITKNLHQGFSNKKIIELSTKKDYVVRTPQIFQHSYNYSFGKTICKVVGWPAFLPIPVYHDHGISNTNFAVKDEINNKANFFLTWSQHRKNIKIKGKKIILLEHPYIYYRKNILKKQKTNAKNGTIVFLPHAGQGFDLNFDYEKFFNKLTKFKKSFLPIVICVYSHDVNPLYLKKIRKYKFPIITIGRTNNCNFVDVFYSTISQFKYCCGSRMGSFVPLSHEMGLKVFILKNNVKYRNINNENFSINEDLRIFPLEKKVDSVFDIKNLNKYQLLKNKLVNDMLNIGIKKKLFNIFFLEFLRLFPYYIFLIIKDLINRLIK